jgi:ribosome-binding factor A
MARRSSSNRPYDRTARLNELIREIVADNLRQIDDERLELVSITGVRVDPEVRTGVVFFDTPEVDGSGDEVVLEAFDELRTRLQAAINRESRLRRTPVLEFRPDLALRGGEQIDAILRGLDRPGDDDGDGADVADGGEDGPSGAPSTALDDDAAGAD